MDKRTEEYLRKLGQAVDPRKLMDRSRPYEMEADTMFRISNNKQLPKEVREQAYQRAIELHDHVLETVNEKREQNVSRKMDYEIQKALKTGKIAPAPAKDPWYERMVEGEKRRREAQAKWDESRNTHHPRT